MPLPPMIRIICTTQTWGPTYVSPASRDGSPGSYTYSVIGSPNHPITYVSWGCAARFANWLQNGQPTGPEGAGTTDTGAYTLNGAYGFAELGPIVRNPNASIFIPSIDELYKAGYYNSATSSYFKFPLSSNTAPTPAPPGNTPNTANFFSQGTGYAVDGPNYLTDVGAYTASASPSGAFDMAGNVMQWADTRAGDQRYVFGNSWAYAVPPVVFLDVVDDETAYIGFRVASIPEPSTYALAALGLLALVFVRRYGKR